MKKNDATPLILALGVASLYGAVLCAAGSGVLTAPLDDAYIYFQYARQAALGHPFHFNPSDPASTGATSLLYQFWLALLYRLGWTGNLTPWAALLTAAGCLAWSFYSLRALARNWTPLQDGVRPLLLFALCGPLMAGTFLGLEFPFFEAFLLAALAMEAGGRPGRAWIFWLLLALTRPEGQMAAAVVALWKLWLSRAAPKKGGPWWILLGLSTLPSLACLALTGRLTPDSVSPKSPLLDPYAGADRILSGALSFLVDSVKGLWMGFYGSGESVGYLGSGASGNGVAGAFAPLTLLAAAWGVASRRARLKRQWGGDIWTPLLFWAAAVFVVQALTLPVGWNQHRYLLPLDLVVFLGLLLAAGELAHAAREHGNAWALGLGGAFWALFLGFGALSFCQSLLSTWRDASQYQAQHGAMASYLSRNVPASTRVAAVDVGILAYESGLPVQDLVGVVDDRIARVVRQGRGAVLQTLASWPAAERPSLAVLQEGRPDFPPQPLVDLGLLVPRLGLGPSIGGARMELYSWNWAGLESARLPGAGLSRGILKGWKLADELDVGLPSSEAAHSYRALASPGLPPITLLEKGAATAGAAPLVDGGRPVAGEDFALSRLTGGPALLAARLKVDRPCLLEAWDNGRALRPLALNPRDGFNEVALPLPASSGPGRDRLSLRLVSPEGRTLVHASYHYWLYQK